MNKKFDPVAKPKHYNVHPSGVECIEINEWMDYCLGCAWKYVFRHENKINPVEDLNKALWYLERAYAQKERRLLNYTEFPDRYKWLQGQVKKILEVEGNYIKIEALEHIFKLQVHRADDEPSCKICYKLAKEGIEMLIEMAILTNSTIKEKTNGKTK